ncbi:MAG: SRPBCC family protein [Glaciihabitans sp.]
MLTISTRTAAPGIYVEITIAANIERVWELTQTAPLHPRWDLRFSRITPQTDTTATLASGGTRFVYERHLLVHTIRGTGTSLGERLRPDGTRTSALKFTTADRLSPLRDGRGYWRYIPITSPTTGVRFITGFDYEPGWGRFLDDLFMRRLVGWMTAWSFDRLRIWAETGIEPERWPVASTLAFWKRDRPRAGRCIRIPNRGRAMDDAPETLATLERP